MRSGGLAERTFGEIGFQSLKLNRTLGGILS
jgi:hypothetical protein